RILLSDTMFTEDEDLAAIEAVIAHEIGHYAERHVAWMIVFYAGFVGALFWLIQRLFPATGRRLCPGQPPDFENPAGLPVVIVLFTALSLLATPLLSGFSRLRENRADAFSLELARQPDGLIRALLRTVDYRAPSPSRLEEILFYDHPSIERRIERALRFKAGKAETASLPASRPPPRAVPPRS
ncbi:MAG: M48 family metalloprotease, partial [Halieaceae bacterium]|nr:M48 family metalloprotease [Halieaceae bacterium]